MKKKTFVAIALAFITYTTAYSQTLTLEIRGIEKITGTLYIGFYNSAKTFTKKTVFGCAEKVTSKTMIIPIEGLPTGTYAISMYQDENSNKTLDTGLFGIPQEKYGFSNDAMGFAGPPSFKQSKFDFRTDKKIIITLR